jgi:anti-sigma regulatory factor (Ser/Thr protein kinase)
VWSLSSSSTDRIDLVLPALPESVPRIRRALVAFAVSHGYPDPDAVALAVSEAATNAVQHAYPGGASGDVRAVACAEPDMLVVVVRDWGAGMAPRVDSPGLGLGLPTIASLAAALDVEAADGEGTLLRMRFPREAPARAA